VGEIMPESTYTTDPSEAIKNQFSASVETSGGGNTAPVAIPPINLADLPQQPIPDTGPNEAEIFAFYKPLLDQVQNEQTPLSRPVPADISPIGTFLGTLAGNLASTFAQNPAFAAQAQNYLAQHAKQKQAIEEQNYANELAFSAEKRNKIISIRGQILEKTLDEAIKSGDLAKANVASQNLARFQEGLKRESQRQEAQRRQAIVQEEGRQARLTEKTKATAKASEEKTAAAKPMTTKEYLQGINDINKNKNIPNEAKGLFWTDIGPRIRKEATSHEEALEQFHASAILNGEPTVQKSAKQNLLRIVKTRLGLIGKEPNAQDIERLDAALSQYGLTREQLK
jgi:hypothetical protein